MLWNDIVALLSDRSEIDVALPLGMESNGGGPAARAPPSASKAPSPSDPHSGPQHARGRDLRRHREAMARYRLEHRTRKGELERQEHLLVLELRRLLEESKALRTSASDGRPDRLVELQRLVHIDDGLRRERAALEERLAVHEQLRRLLVRDVCSTPAPPLTPETSEPKDWQPQINGRWIQFADDELPFFYRPQTDDECLQHVMRSLEGLRHMLHRFARHPSRVTTTECLGWITEHALEREDPTRPVLRYRFTRQARCRHSSIQELQAQAWRLLTDASVVQRMYTTRVVTTHLQTLSDGSIVHLRNVPTKENHTRFRHVTLTKRLTCGEHLRGGKNAAAVLTVVMDSDCCRLLPAKTATTTTGAEALIKDGGWSIRFIEGVDPADPTAVLVDCTGFQQCADAAHAQHVLMEVCAALLRLEHMILAPQLLPL
ncbi:hypothetical protein ATCC90586_000416 [Pythium insidiosum]|nr:hypothetical protein ATCC90586_000416 [Pythium insidiosum]